MSTLAVCVPVLGTPSERFVQRHVEQLRPDRTVVLSRRPAPDATGTWGTDVPVLWLDALEDEWGGAREQAAVADFLRHHGVRAVLAEFLDIWLPFLPIFQARGSRCVAHGHGYDVSARLREEHWRSAYVAGYRDVSAVVTMSEHSRTRLVEIGLPHDRVHVIPYGVDVPALRPRSRSQQEAVEVLLVGRLVVKKSPLRTWSACVQAWEAGARLRVTVIGDGPLMGELEQGSRAGGPPVELRGSQPHAEVLAAMQRADIFCQHSVVNPETGDEEGLPVAILEAMAHGLPVVSTRHAGIPEAVEDGVSGLLVDEGDVDAMSERIRLLAEDAGLRYRLGAAARDRVLSHFSWAAEREALLDLLRVDR